MEVLNIHGTQVADLTPLTLCRALKALHARGTRITAAKVAALQKALPNCKVEWDGK
jgi:hypothetical protein